MHWWLPESVSTYGAKIDQLFYLILGITGIAFVLVEATLLLFLLRYRRQEGRRAFYTHGNVTAEVIWTVIPAIILVLLTFSSQRLWAEIRYRSPANPFEVEVTAEQFAWNIRYPGPDGQFDTPDDMTTINQLHIPVRHPVRVWLKSKDVIHSFFLPQFRLKQDTVPGLTGQVWLEAIKTGQYEIVCAELCGLGHYRMRGFLTIETTEALETWLKATKAEE